MDSIENDMADPNGSVARYLKSAGDMFSGREMEGRKKTMNDLSEIGKLNVREEECLAELNAKLEGLGNSWEGGGPAVRYRLQESRHGEFIIDMSKHPEEAEL